MLLLSEGLNWVELTIVRLLSQDLMFSLPGVVMD
jgi:hypothetical protein